MPQNDAITEDDEKSDVDIVNCVAPVVIDVTPPTPPAAATPIAQCQQIIPFVFVSFDEDESGVTTFIVNNFYFEVFHIKRLFPDLRRIADTSWFIFCIFKQEI